MSIQTYCVRGHIESLIGIAGVAASVDDNEDALENTAITTIEPPTTRTEVDYVADAIKRGAIEINAAIIYQYTLAAVATNDWLIWANAWLAAYYLRIRRGNPCEQSILDNVAEVRRILNEIRWGRMMLPGQLPSMNSSPAVSNFNPELGKISAPIRVIKDESTGGDPSSHVKRNVAHLPGNL